MQSRFAQNEDPTAKSESLVICHMFARGQGPICLGLSCEGINKGLLGVFRSLGPYISAVGSNLQDKVKGPMGYR